MSWLDKFFHADLNPSQFLSQVHMGTDGPAFKQFVVEKKLNIYASTKHFNPNPNALPKAADGAKDATKLQFVWGIIAEVGYMIGDCICTQCHLSFCWLRPLL